MDLHLDEYRSDRTDEQGTLKTSAFAVFRQTSLSEKVRREPNGLMNKSLESPK